MRIPQLNFTEINVGTRAILPNVRNRLGIVGQFSRGPANVFSYVTGYTDFAQRYGDDEQLGSVGYKAAYNEGARDFGIVRVLGNSKAAQGSFIVKGTSVVDSEFQFRVSGIQEIIADVNTNFDMTVETNGSAYSGSEDGHYVVVVTDASNPEAVEVKYKFVSVNEAFSRLDALDYVTQEELDAITTDPEVEAGEGRFYIDSTTEAGTAKSLENGISIQYGQDSNENLYFLKGQRFTFYVESTEVSFPILKGETAIDTTNKIIANLQGVDPIGNVYSDVVYIDSSTNDNYQSTITVELDNNNEMVQGTKGSRYSFLVNTTNSNNVVTLSDARWDDTTPSVFYSTDADAISLSPGDKITSIGSTNVTLPSEGVEITGVAVSATVQGEYEIYLANALTGTTDAGPFELEVSPEATGGLQISSAGSTLPFSKGVDGAKNASKIFYSLTGQRLIEVSAVSPGAWGNNLYIDIIPVTNTEFRIVVEDKLRSNTRTRLQSVESFNVNLATNGAVDAEGLITATSTSDLIRASFLPKVDNPEGFNVNLLLLKPERLAPVNATAAGENLNDPRHPSYYGPSKLKGVALEKGTDGPLITEQDYIEAIKVLGEANVNYIFAPGIWTNFPKAQSALVAAAEKSTEIDGLKLAILSARPGLRPIKAKTEISHINSDRAVAVAGWSTFATTANVKRFGTSPDAIYAGKLATIGFTISPAARSSSGSVASVSEVDTAKYSSIQSLQLYTDARLEVLFPEQNFGGIYFLNGRTTSSDTAWDKVVIRRTYDVIRQDLYLGLQSYKSEPHTELLRKQIESTINAYFSNLARGNKIANFTPAVADESNNAPENYINGEVNISVAFLPLYAADYINIAINRNAEGGFEVGTSANL